MQDLSNKCLRAFCARISLILGFYWPLALNDEPPVTEASPDFLSSMRREWSHHSCSRLQHSSEDAIATVRLRFLRPQSSIVPTNIVVKLVENDIDCFPNPQPIQRTCSSPDCVAQTADHPPVERGRVRLPSCLLRAQLSSLRDQSGQSFLNRCRQPFAEVRVLAQFSRRQYSNPNRISSEPGDSLAERNDVLERLRHLRTLHQDEAVRHDSFRPLSLRKES